MLRNFAVVVLACCAAASAQAREEVRFWHSMTGPQAAELERLTARFNAEQSAYRVVSAYKGPLDSSFAQALAAKKAGAAPHIVQVREALTDELMAEHIVLPLWQVMADAGERFDAELLPAVTGAFLDGEHRLLALPLAAATPVLYYNREALRRAGIEPPVPPRNWYKMPAVLEALLDTGSTCPYTTSSPAWVLIENMSAWHNREFSESDPSLDGAGTRLTFNSRLMVRWIAILSTWRKAGYFKYWGRGSEPEARFAAGQCALLTASSASYPVLRERAGFELGVAELPYYDDFDEAPQNTLAGGAPLWVLAGKPRSAYRGAARFLAFLLRPDVQAQWQQKTGFMPMSAEGYRYAQRSGFYVRNPELGIAVRQLLDKAPTRYSKALRLSDLRRVRGIIDEELEAVWNGSLPPLDALNAAVARGNLLLSHARRWRSPP